MINLPQGPSVAAAAADITFKDIAQGGAAVLIAGVLWYVVRVLAQVFKESAEREKAAAERADATARHNAALQAQQNKECAERNEKTVAVVDGICDRFSETTLTLVREMRINKTG